MTTQAIVAALDAEIAKLKEVRALLAQDVEVNEAIREPAAEPIKRRRMSKAARARIAAAARKRWAAFKKAAK